MSPPSSDSVKANRRFYLRFFEGRSPVCDAGCGDGVFLRLLRDKGTAVEGIEPRTDRAGLCRADGFVCHEGTAEEVLRSMPGRFGGLMLSDVIEHAAPEGARKLVESARTALKPGGRLVVVTPNPEDANVMSRDFWDDPTHVRPYTLAALTELVLENGFSVHASGESPRTSLDDLPTFRRLVAAAHLAALRMTGAPPRCLGDLYLVADKFL